MKIEVSFVVEKCGIIEVPDDFKALLLPANEISEKEYESLENELRDFIYNEQDNLNVMDVQIGSYDTEHHSWIMDE